MGRLIETVGDYAKTPYYIAQTGTSVYCVEELCHVLCRNTFLLDRGILDPELVRWLEAECGLRELAKPLYSLVSKNASPSSFVGAILEYVHFSTERERKETEELLRLGADMDAVTRKKNFADYLVENGRFAQAVSEYERMLKEMPSINHVMRSEIFHNKGVAFCRLFSFEEAAQAYLAAYRENPENERAASAYLTALRMSLPEADYIGFIAANPQWHEQSLKVEKRMSAVQAAWEEPGAYGEEKVPGESRDTAYYEKVSEKIAKLQKKYREMVANP